MKSVDEAIRERLERISVLQEEVTALRRIQPILEGRDRVQAEKRFKPQPNSDATLAAVAIRVAKRPLSIAEILKDLAGEGKAPQKNSIVSALAKMAKSGHVFYRCVQPNTFGLLEWKERPDAREEAELLRGGG